ncbi:MAG: hypothetical protein IGNPGNKH_00588 [Sodalis sp. Ffu]|nr:MAG: hypothetical protein IGNPGNKH_00588 [Sodalis sp. Ffu]
MVCNLVYFLLFGRCHCLVYCVYRIPYCRISHGFEVYITTFKITNVVSCNNAIIKSGSLMLKLFFICMLNRYLGCLTILTSEWFKTLLS